VFDDFVGRVSGGGVGVGLCGALGRPFAGSSGSGPSDGDRFIEPLRLHYEPPLW